MRFAQMILSIIVGVLMFFPFSGHAGIIKKECVGRMQMEFPGDTDVAGYPFGRLTTELEIHEAQPYFQFSDGQDAEWSRLSYTGGTYISNEISEDEYRQLMLKVEQRRKINEKAAYRDHPADGSKREFEPIGMDSREGEAWRVFEFYTVFLKLRNHVLFWDVGGSLANSGRNAKVATDIIKGARYRAPNEIPAGSGVCLPFAYIADDGTNLHNVATTFRLRLHPDVTVVLEEGRFAPSNFDSTRRTISLADKVDEFWAQLLSSPLLVSVANLKGGAQRIMFAGNLSLASFVKLTWVDKSIGYGYLVIDQSASNSTSSVRFFMSSKPSNAIAKNVNPVGEAEFYEMATSIADSVKHRP